MSRTAQELRMTLTFTTGCFLYVLVYKIQLAKCWFTRIAFSFRLMTTDTRNSVLIHPSIHPSPGHWTHDIECAWVVYAQHPSPCSNCIRVYIIDNLGSNSVQNRSLHFILWEICSGLVFRSSRKLRQMQMQAKADACVPSLACELITRTAIWFRASSFVESNKNQYNERL